MTESDISDELRLEVIRVVHLFRLKKLTQIRKEVEESLKKEKHWRNQDELKKQIAYYKEEIEKSASYISLTIN